MVKTNQQSVYPKSVCQQEGEGEETSSIFLLHQTNDEILRRKDSGPSKNIFLLLRAFFFYRVSTACKSKSKRAAVLQMDSFTFNDGVNENKVCNMLLPAYLQGVVLALV